jgi:hypothetical protein
MFIRRRKVRIEIEHSTLLVAACASPAPDIQPTPVNADAAVVPPQTLDRPHQNGSSSDLQEAQ